MIPGVSVLQYSTVLYRNAADITVPDQRSNSILRQFNYVLRQLSDLSRFFYKYSMTTRKVRIIALMSDSI